MPKQQKFYAVRKGKHPGIYTSWEETKAQVTGYSGAIYKSFPTKAAAQQFLTAEKNAPLATTASSKAKSRPDIVIFTDGGSRNHGNVAGGHVKATDVAAWAYLIDFHGKQHADTGGEYGVTNNKMEITALVQALSWLVEHKLNDKSVGVISDSRYVLDAIQKGWLSGWKKRNWTRRDGELKNAELWQQLDQLLEKFSQIQYAWTKGHATNKGNVFVDELLNQTMDKM